MNNLHYYIYYNNGDDMIIPTVLEKKSNKEYAFDLYSRLLNDRIIMLNGEITDEVSSIIVSELLYLDSISNDDISLYINSPGGSITSGFAIYDTMQFIKSRVKTICIGLCASMAAFLLSSGDYRYCLKNSEVMIHQPLGGVQGQATEIKIVAERILYLKKKLYEILASNTKQDIKKIEDDCERDYYLNSVDALNYGIVDEIL